MELPFRKCRVLLTLGSVTFTTDKEQSKALFLALSARELL